MKRNEILGEISDKALQRYKQDAHTEIQGAKFGRGKGKPESEKIIAKREKGMSAANKRLKSRDDERRANYKRPEPAKTSSGPQDWYGQNRYMGDSVAEGEVNVNRLSVAKLYRQTGRNSGNIAKWAKKEAGLPQEAKVYFDDADFVLGSETIVPAALVDPTVKMKDLVSALVQATKQGVSEGLDEGRSDYVGDAIEGLRMAKPGLEKEDFLDELYSYIDAEMGMEAAERAFADKGSYDDWYESYADAVDENANMLKVAKDDDKQTILQNPSTGVQTQIDKTNPNAPRLTQDDQGKLKLAAPMGAGGQQQQQQKPTLVGKDVEVATESAALTAMLKIAGLR